MKSYRSDRCIRSLTLAHISSFECLKLFLLLFFLLAIGAMEVLATEKKVRENALAGTWYPADPVVLSATVDQLLDEAGVGPERLIQPVRALIVPHAGYRYSGATAAVGFNLVRGNAYKRVIILAPAHRSGFSGLSVADVDFYQTPLGEVPLDQSAVTKLRKSVLVSAQPEAHRLEHSIEIELPFLQQVLAPGWKLLPVLVGQLRSNDYPAAARLLRPLADEDTLLVVSSDFTHYGERFGYVPFPADDSIADNIEKLDAGALARIQDRDREGLRIYQKRTGITICGFRPIMLLLDMLPETARLKQVAYKTSGELTGDWKNSVSYGVVVMTGSTPIAVDEQIGTTNLDQNALDRLHQIAVAGVEWAVLGKSDVNQNRLDRLASDLPPELKKIRGSFVTLTQNDYLRGCIGHPYPSRPLYLSVLENGFSAAVRDHRFLPVTAEDLKGLEIEISLLTQPRTIDSPEQFLPGKHGIILSKNGSRAVFLPEVATEQGWSREATLTHLSTKAGLPPDAWKKEAKLEVFENQKYSAPYPGSR
ncbi:MAG: AmmeMemoRadiSam system protein B [Gammaproteobacteria bacterium]|nr:AmmeMemoRadiSam system protein B [Gammaproteobacteria bacterium]